VAERGLDDGAEGHDAEQGADGDHAAAVSHEGDCTISGPGGSRDRSRRRREEEDGVLAVVTSMPYVSVQEKYFFETEATVLPARVKPYSWSQNPLGEQVVGTGTSTVNSQRKR
jgi:hypothetical protein